MNPTIVEFHYQNNVIQSREVPNEARLDLPSNKEEVMVEDSQGNMKLYVVCDITRNYYKTGLQITVDLTDAHDVGSTNPEGNLQ